MIEPLIIHKGRTNVFKCRLGINVSDSEFTSQIRKEANVESEIIADFNVEFETDGVDGVLVLTIDDSDTAPVQIIDAFMDLKRVTGGEPYPVFDKPIPVTFRAVVSE